MNMNYMPPRFHNQQQQHQHQALQAIAKQGRKKPIGPPSGGTDGGRSYGGYGTQQGMSSQGPKTSSRMTGSGPSQNLTQGYLSQGLLSQQVGDERLVGMINRVANRLFSSPFRARDLTVSWIRRRASSRKPSKGDAACDDDVTRKHQIGKSILWKRQDGRRQDRDEVITGHEKNEILQVEHRIRSETGECEGLPEG